MLAERLDLLKKCDDNEGHSSAPTAQWSRIGLEVRTNTRSMHVDRSSRPLQSMGRSSLDYRRREWFQHERESHRSWWQCGDPCGRSFHAKQEIESHIRHEHNQMMSADEVSSMAEAFQRGAPLNSLADCCFCKTRLTALSA